MGELGPLKPMRYGSGLRSRGPFAGVATPLELLNFKKEKDQRGRQDLAKNLQIFAEVILHAGSPYGDGGLSSALRAQSHHRTIGLG